MGNPKVSVIVPCYGVEKYLDRCMKSLIEQTLQDIEVILIDDGSPDNIPIMCDKWAEKDARVKVIHKKNAGLGYARSSGLEIAAGEYVSFVDSDDYVSTKMYESLFQEAQKSDADLVFSNFKTEQRNGIWVDSKEVEKREEWVGDKVEEFMLDMVACAPHEKKERKYQMSVWHSIYRRSIIVDNNIRFYSEREVVSEDLPFQIDYMLHTHKVVYLPQSYYYYCLNGGSLTATFKQEKYEGFKDLYHLLNKKLAGIEGYRLRTSRFFIGYVRSFLLQMYVSDFSNKKEFVRIIVNDDIWKGISQVYHPSYLPAYPKMVYKAILQKRVLTLILCYEIANYMKKFKNR